MFWAIIFGCIFWISGYLQNQSASHTLYNIRVPAWFRFFFGALRTDGTLNVSGLGFQITGYLLGLGEIIQYLPLNRTDFLIYGLLWFLGAFSFLVLWIIGASYWLNRQ